MPKPTSDAGAPPTPPTPPPRPKARSLLPREHGAYAQLGFPLLTALLLGSLNLSVALLVGSIVAFFLAHEPVIVLLGGRGGRALRETGARARQRAIALLGLGTLAGLAGLWLAPAEARLAALIPLGFGAAFTPLALKRREKTALGELLVAFTLSATLMPVAVAGGLGPGASLIAFGVWAVAFSLSTVTVRAIISRAKRQGRPGWAQYAAPALSLLAIAVGLALAVRGALPTLAAVAVIPTALVAFVFGMLGVHPRNLRRMGWSLVASNVVVLAALVIGLA